MTDKPRVIVWYSNGAASAVAGKLALAQYVDHEIVLATTDTGSEHPDNARFRRDCERWYGASVMELRSERYRDTWQVWEERRYLVGPDGALCTGELKKRLRYRFQRPNDIQVFGFTSEEAKRADRFRGDNPDVDLRTPLIERGLGKADCLAVLARAGIELPAMYKLGYRNNNCIPCVKGGMGYWNKIRRDFPEQFARMADLEQRLGATVLRDEIPNSGRSKVPLPLLELDPQRGRYATEYEPECSILCSSVSDELDNPELETC